MKRIQQFVEAGVVETSPAGIVMLGKAHRISMLAGAAIGSITFWVSVIGLVLLAADLTGLGVFSLMKAVV